MRVPVGMGFIVIRGKDTANVFGYGGRKLADGSPKPHQGWDCAAMVGSNVYAIKDGTVEFVVNADAGDYGKQVCLRFAHQGQTLYALYAHLNSIRVAAGQNVAEGDVLGTVGQTGNARGQHHTQAHLHFEVRTKPHAGLGLGDRLDPSLILGISPVVETLFPG